MPSLYAQSPVLQLIQQIGWDAVICLKQELYQSAMGLFARRPPDQTFTEKRDHKTYRVQLWDTDGLAFTIDNPEPVWAVRSEEELERNRYRQGERTPHVTSAPFPSLSFASLASPAGRMRTTAGWI